MRNEFSVSAGGLFIPKVYNGKNKTFFFFAYEGYQLRSAATRSIAVPTPAFREGDFSALADAQGRRFTIYDPLTTNTTTWTRTPFPENRLPIGRQSPLAKYLYSVTPGPTRGDNPLVAPNWFGLGFANTKQHTETIRIDHRLNDKNNLYFRYSPASTGEAQRPYKRQLATLDARRAGIGSESAIAASRTGPTFLPTFFSGALESRARYQPTPFWHREISTKLGLPNPFGGVSFRIPYSDVIQHWAGHVLTRASIPPSTTARSTISIRTLPGSRAHEFQFGGLPLNSSDVQRPAISQDDSTQLGCADWPLC